MGQRRPEVDRSSPFGRGSPFLVRSGTLASKERKTERGSAQVCALFARSAAAREVLETAEAEKDFTVLLEVYRADLAKGAGWESVYAGPGAGCRATGLDPATRYRLRIAVRAARGQISRYGTFAFATTGPPPPPPRLRVWLKTPAETPRARIVNGSGWTERTCELGLRRPRGLGALPADGTFLVLWKDRDETDGPWKRCYRGKLPRFRATSLVAGRTYLFRVALAVAEAPVTPYSKDLVLLAPGALPAGGAPADAMPPDPTPRPGTTEDSGEEPAAPSRPEPADRPAEADDDGPLLRTVGGSEWRVAWSRERGRPFYHNVTSGRSQWTPPLEAWT